MADNSFSNKNGHAPLKDVISRYLDTFKLKCKIQETQLIKNWANIVGPMIEKNTFDLNIKRDKLYIKINSAPLKQELFYSRQAIIDRVNEELGEKVISEIIFL